MEQSPLNADELWEAMQDFLISEDLALSKSDKEIEPFSPLRSDSPIFERDDKSLDTVANILEILKEYHEYTVVENIEPTFSKAFPQESWEAIAMLFGVLKSDGRLMVPPRGLTTALQKEDRTIQYSLWKDNTTFYIPSHTVEGIIRATAYDGSHLLAIDGLGERREGVLSVFAFQLMLQRIQENSVDTLLFIDATEGSKDWKNTFLFGSYTSDYTEFTSPTRLVTLRNSLMPPFGAGYTPSGEKVY